jgi:MFS family permease
MFVANLVSDIGTFMQSVGAAWLMVSLGADATMVALTQTASSLPFFVFALPAGAIGDIVDRRRLILYCEFWMVGVAIVLAIATIAGFVTPWLLLGLTFALAAGDAAETPTWRAVLPGLVGKGDLAAASALNGIGFNFARAVGPALAGGLIAAVGVGPAFVVNAISFVGVLVVIARWRPAARHRSTPVETVTGASVAALRYVRHSPAMRVVLWRAGVTMLAASALLALLPSLARSVSDRPIVYGLLLGFFGAGAVLGAVVMQPARARWTPEAVGSGAVVVLAVTIAAAGELRSFTLLALTMLVAGAGWLVFTSLVSALVQALVPDWARARVLAVFILVFQGGLAVGGVLWGVAATTIGIPQTLLIAGLSTMATIALRVFGRLPDARADTTPWNHWHLPTAEPPLAAKFDDRPALVTVRYQVHPQHEHAFVRAMEPYGRIRRRDGAFSWGVFRDVERAGTFLETFLVSSWAEHLRQHERFTRGDGEVEAHVLRYLDGDPVVEHLVRVDPRSAHPPPQSDTFVQ